MYYQIVGLVCGKVGNGNFLKRSVEKDGEQIIGGYFHVLNDLERVGDHAENFHEIGVEMKEKGLQFSDVAKTEICGMRDKVLNMFETSEKIFKDSYKALLPKLTEMENGVDGVKRELTARHFTRLADGGCKVELSPYYSSTIVGLERVADHLTNIGYSIVNPTGSQTVTE